MKCPFYSSNCKSSLKNDTVHTPFSSIHPIHFHPISVNRHFRHPFDIFDDIHPPCASSFYILLTYCCPFNCMHRRNHSILSITMELEKGWHPMRSPRYYKMARVICGWAPITVSNVSMVPAIKHFEIERMTLHLSRIIISCKHYWIITATCGY